MSSTITSHSVPNMATVKYHDAHKTAPVLTAGTVSPAILAQLIQYFNSYFHKCKVADEDKVRNILMSFQDIKIDNWLKNNTEQFTAADFSFEDFTTELRKRFLDPHWESSIVRTVVNSQMTESESFSTFANRVMHGNNLLIGTTSRLDTTALRAKLEINMSTYLADKITRLRPTDKERINAIVVFEDWLHEVTLLDEEMTADLKRIADFTREHYQIAKKQRTDNASVPTQYNTYPQQQQRGNPPPNFPPPLSGANAITQNYNHFPPQQPNPTSNFRGGFRSSFNQRPIAGKRTRCPKLLPSEYELLDQHAGCKKCRKFYVNHITPNCPDDFPNPDTYVTLTEEMALKAQAAAAIASTYNPHNSIPTSSYMSQPPYNQIPSSCVEELCPESSTHQPNQASVAAILPTSTATPFALGNGTSDTESESSNVSPISVPHYIWNANVHGTAEFPTPIPCLLDNGAHLILIRPETVVDLGLKVRKLHTPERVSVAINSRKHTFLLEDYVVLSLSSLNNAWTSRPVRALIAHNLCVSILLGLPFLKHNKIVIDHDSDTAIAKDSKFDLLNENLPNSLTIPEIFRQKISPKQKRESILQIRRNVMKELHLKCSERQQFLETNNLFENVH